MIQSFILWLAGPEYFAFASYMLGGFAAVMAMIVTATLVGLATLVWEAWFG